MMQAQKVARYRHLLHRSMEHSQNGTAKRLFKINEKNWFMVWSFPCKVHYNHFKLQIKSIQIVSLSIGKLKISYFHIHKFPYRGYNFSDGVGDGQLQACNDFEIKQLKTACSMIDECYQPKITFVVVQKRINIRFFKVSLSFVKQNDLYIDHPKHFLCHLEYRWR